MSELKPCPFCGGAAQSNAISGRTFAWCPKSMCAMAPMRVEDWNKRADPAPTAEYLLGYAQAVLRAARDRAEKAYRTAIDDCGDMRAAHHHAMDEVWPHHRSPKTRDALDRYTLEAQKEADEWSGLKGPMKLTAPVQPDGRLHLNSSGDQRTLGERLRGECPDCGGGVHARGCDGRTNAEISDPEQDMPR